MRDATTDSVFLLGARQTGKTTLLLNLFPNARLYDLLEADTFTRLQRNPELLRQELLLAEDGELVIIDEIQLLPELLNEVHWLITRKSLRFILSGSSARKLKRRGVNTLGGRALRNVLYPLVSAEIPDFDLDRALIHGMIPRHYLAPEDLVFKRLQAYINVYLTEEIKAEALVRNLGSFSRFMDATALTNGEIVVYSNIAQDCGVDAKTVKEYFNILTDTMIGYMIPAFTGKMTRRVVQAPRFYYFDVAIPNFILGRRALAAGTPEYGHAFEHFMIQELVAYLGYRDRREKLSYWRTYQGKEVDAVIGDGAVAIEFKAVEMVKNAHTHGLKAFAEAYPQARLVIVSLDPRPRMIAGNVEVMPYADFLDTLWHDRLF